MPSSIIDFIAYQESRSELTVTFTTGRSYVYGLVPKRIYEDFRGARSKGNFFNAHIRDRYPTRPMRSVSGALGVMHQHLEQRGYVIVRRLVNPFLIMQLIQVLEATAQPRLARRGETYGIRNLLEVPEIRSLVRTEPVKALLENLLGANASAVRGMFFDKTASANWPVLWHQDLSLAVAEKHDIEGWTAWSVKNDVHHVQPPAYVLERMLTVRLHLDDCGEDNGPLKVLAGTHGLGRIARERIPALRNEIEETVCCMQAGDALIMRPLLLHASSPAAKPQHRRVIHLEFAPEGLLPIPLRCAFD